METHEESTSQLFVSAMWSRLDAAFGSLTETVSELQAIALAERSQKRLEDYPEYGSWKAIKARCNCVTNKAYHNYGGRGIRVCPEWQFDFLRFLAHIGPRPGPEYSVERLDNNGNYEPGNVKWATPLEQGRNTRLNHTICLNGVTKCLSEWARLHGKEPDLVFQRMRFGWTIEDALNKPVGNAGARGERWHARRKSK